MFYKAPYPNEEAASVHRPDQQAERNILLRGFRVHVR
jgi:hypothetical protein